MKEIFFFLLEARTIDGTCAKMCQIFKLQMSDNTWELFFFFANLQFPEFFFSFFSDSQISSFQFTHQVS